MNRMLVTLIGGPADGRRVELCETQQYVYTSGYMRAVPQRHPNQSEVVAVHCERHDYEVFFSVGNLRVFKHSSLSHEHAMAQLINRYPPEVSR